MTFNIKRSIIKGTKLHKASIAKAKQPVVAQTRTQADPELVQASKELGKSYIPGAIDFSLDTKTDFKWAKKKKKKKKTKEEWDIDEFDPTGDYDPCNPEHNPGLKGCTQDEEEVDSYIDEEDPEYTEEDIDADLERITKEEEEEGGDDSQDTTLTNEQWELEQEREGIRRAEENTAILEAESAARRAHAAATILPKIDVKQIPQPPVNTENLLTTTTPPTIDEAKTQPAHLDPNLNTQVNTDIEGTGDFQTPPVSPHHHFAANLPSDAKDHFTADYNDYSYTTVVVDEDENGERDGVYEEREIWTYKGKEINENQVSTEAYTNIMNNRVEDLRRKEDQPTTEEPVQEQQEEESTTQSTSNKKPEPSDYRWGGTGGWKHKGEEKYKTDLENWKQSKTPLNMRDDRIFKNATPGGIIQKAMLKNGYNSKN